MHAATMPLVLAVTGALLAQGCGDDVTGDSPGDEAARTYHGSTGGSRPRPREARVSGSMPVHTKVLRSPAGSLIRGSGGGAAGGGGGRAPGQPRGRVMSAAEAQEAARAIAQAPPEGDTPCAQAFNALRDIQAAYREHTPSAKRRGRRGLANRQRFMEGCLAKPRDMQQCMVPSYLRAHSDECDRVRTHWGQRMVLPRGWGQPDTADRTQEEPPAGLTEPRPLESGDLSAPGVAGDQEDLPPDEDE